MVLRSFKRMIAFSSQRKYANDILNKFEMINLRLVFTPVEEKLKLVRKGKGKNVHPTYYKSWVGSLRHFIAMRLDIVFGIRLLSRLMEESRLCHLQVAKRILHYLKGTLNDEIFEPILFCFLFL